MNDYRSEHWIAIVGIVVLLAVVVFLVAFWPWWPRRREANDRLRERMARGPAGRGE